MVQQTIEKGKFYELFYEIHDSFSNQPKRCFQWFVFLTICCEISINIMYPVETKIDRQQQATGETNDMVRVLI